MHSFKWDNNAKESSVKTDEVISFDQCMSRTNTFTRASIRHPSSIATWTTPQTMGWGRVQNLDEFHHRATWSEKQPLQITMPIQQLSISQVCMSLDFGKKPEHRTWKTLLSLAILRCPFCAFSFNKENNYYLFIFFPITDLTKKTDQTKEQKGMIQSKGRAKPVHDVAFSLGPKRSSQPQWPRARLARADERARPENPNPLWDASHQATLAVERERGAEPCHQSAFRPFQTVDASVASHKLQSWGHQIILSFY